LTEQFELLDILFLDFLADLESSKSDKVPISLHKKSAVDKSVEGNENEVTVNSGICDKILLQVRKRKKRSNK